MATNLGTPSISSEIRAAARYLYETTTLTFAEVAAEIRAGERTVKRWSSIDGGWQRLSTPKISARAQLAADRINSAISTIGPAATPTQMQKATSRVRESAAIDHRSNILARHRSEWDVTRGLLNEAIKARDLERAKLAKITAETLTIVQANERRAWGLDQPANFGDFAAVIVIERESG